MIATLAAATAQAATITVDTLSDASSVGTCTLRDAINTAQGSPVMGSDCTSPVDATNSIVFKSGLTGPIMLGSTLPAITGSLTMTGPTDSPGITIDGGGAVQVMQVVSGATLNLNNLTIAHGFNYDGGGISNFGTLIVTNSTFSRNRAASLGNDYGGGILNAGSGTLTVNNATFSDNSAASLGSGVGYGGGISNLGTLIVTNSTFSGNSTGSTGLGGGIYGGRTEIVTNSTFSGNSAGLGGGIENFFGTVSAKGTILAGQTSGGNCHGTITDVGYNISDDSSCGFTHTGSANNGDMVDPLLAVAGLADNGGPTQTIALQPSSPAIDAIPHALCTDQATTPNQLTADQRGMPRPDPEDGPSGACDIGAYELQEAALVYGFVGLQSPYAPPSIGAFKIASAIPLKWQYTNGGGMVIDSANALPQVQIVGPYICGVDAGAAMTITVDAAGGSGYQYDLATNTWQFNWKTGGLQAGCYNIGIKSGQTGQVNGPFPIQLRQ